MNTWTDEVAEKFGLWKHQAKALQLMSEKESDDLYGREGAKRNIGLNALDMALGKTRTMCVLAYTRPKIESLLMRTVFDATPLIKDVCILIASYVNTSLHDLYQVNQCKLERMKAEREKRLSDWEEICREADAKRLKRDRKKRRQEAAFVMKRKGKLYVDEDEKDGDDGNDSNNASDDEVDEATQRRIDEGPFPVSEHYHPDLVPYDDYAFYGGNYEIHETMKGLNKHFVWATSNVDESKLAEEDARLKKYIESVQFVNATLVVCPHHILDNVWVKDINMLNENARRNQQRNQQRNQSSSYSSSSRTSSSGTSALSSSQSVSDSDDAVNAKSKDKTKITSSSSLLDAIRAISTASKSSRPQQRKRKRRYEESSDTESTDSSSSSSSPTSSSSSSSASSPSSPSSTLSLTSDTSEDSSEELKSSSSRKRATRSSAKRRRKEGKEEKEEKDDDSDQDDDDTAVSNNSNSITKAIVSRKEIALARSKDDDRLRARLKSRAKRLNGSQSPETMGPIKYCKIGTGTTSLVTAAATTAGTDGSSSSSSSTASSSTTTSSATTTAGQSVMSVEHFRKQTIVICNANAFTKLATFCHLNRVKWARVIFDEIDAINIPNCPSIDANYYWGITATWTGLANIPNHGFLYDRFGRLTKEQVESMVIKIDKSEIDPRCRTFKPFIKTVVECKCTADHEIIHSLYPSSKIDQLLSEDLVPEAKMTLIRAIDSELRNKAEIQASKYYRLSILELKIILILKNGSLTRANRLKHVYNICQKMTAAGICFRCSNNRLTAAVKNPGRNQDSSDSSLKNQGSSDSSSTPKEGKDSKKAEESEEPWFFKKSKSTPKRKASSKAKAKTKATKTTKTKTSTSSSFSTSSNKLTAKDYDNINGAGAGAGQRQPMPLFYRSGCCHIDFCASCAADLASSSSSSSAKKKDDKEESDESAEKKSNVFIDCIICWNEVADKLDIVDVAEEELRKKEDKDHPTLVTLERLIDEAEKIEDIQYPTKRSRAKSSTDSSKMTFSSELIDSSIRFVFKATERAKNRKAMNEATVTLDSQVLFKYVNEPCSFIENGKLEKMDALLEIVRHHIGERICIFINNPIMSNIISFRLEALDVVFKKLMGSPPRVQNLLHKFEEKIIDILLIGSSCSQRGLNIPMANVFIIYDAKDAQTIMQEIARGQRFGRDKNSALRVYGLTKPGIQSDLWEGASAPSDSPLSEGPEGSAVAAVAIGSSSSSSSSSALVVPSTLATPAEVAAAVARVASLSSTNQSSSVSRSNVVMEDDDDDDDMMILSSSTKKPKKTAKAKKTTKPKRGKRSSSSSAKSTKTRKISKTSKRRKRSDD